MSQTKRIGLDRRIDLEWLDTVAAQVAAGNERKAIRSRLFELLEGQVAGGTKRGTSCHKTVGILAGAWIDVTADAAGLRDRAVGLLPSLSPRERVALHWSLLTAGYPFFGDLAESGGRLLSLQGSMTLAQLTRRMHEAWGDRSTMKVATQRITRSMTQWGVLADSTDRGVYVPPPRPIVVRGQLAGLLLEGLLIHLGEAIPIDQATRHPALFPFDVQFRAHSLRQSARFEVHRQGLDVDVVRLAAPRVG